MEDSNPINFYTYDELKEKNYILLILTIIILNIINNINKIVYYFNNINYYNSSLFYKLNIYDNIYNNIYTYDYYDLGIIIINSIILALIIYIVYYNIFEDKNKNFININDTYIILYILFVILFSNIILYIYNYYYSYNSINLEYIKNIKNKIYSKIDGNFLNFMYNDYKYNNIDNFGEHMNDDITPILKKYMNEEIKPLLNKYINNDIKEVIKKNIDNDIKPLLKKYINYDIKSLLKKYIDNDIAPILKKYIDDYIIPILKKYNDNNKKIENEDEIVNNILKIFITYRFYKYYINSKNIDDICNINNIISKDKDLFLYLIIDNDNILFPLQPKNTNIDAIIEQFKSKSKIEFNYIKDNYKNIKDNVIKYYNNIQNETNEDIISIKKNTSTSLNYGIIVYLIIITILLIILIILYFGIFYYKSKNEIIDIFCAFNIIIYSNIEPFLKIIKFITLKFIKPV